MEPAGPRWAPRWLCELCYMGIYNNNVHFNIKTVVPRLGFLTRKIRRYRDGLKFITNILLLVVQHSYIKTTADISTHWSLTTHICVNKLDNHWFDNGLLPVRRQDIIWTNAGILVIGPTGTKFNETLIQIHTFSFKKMHLKMSSGQWWWCCLGLIMLTHWSLAAQARVSELGQHWFR